MLERRRRARQQDDGKAASESILLFSVSGQPDKRGRENEGDAGQRGERVQQNHGAPARQIQCRRIGYVGQIGPAEDALPS